MALLVDTDAAFHRVRRGLLAATSYIRSLFAILRPAAPGIPAPEKYPDQEGDPDAY